MTQPTQEAGEDRRQQILEAALQAFAAKGFRGATNRDIAQAVGVAPGLIYWYFKDKEDLLNTVLEAYAPFGKVELPFAAMEEVEPARMVPLIIRSLSVVLEQPHTLLILRIIVSEAITNPALGQRFNSLIKQLIDPISHYLRRQIALGRLRDEDPLLMVQALLSQVGLFFIRRIIGQDPELGTIEREQLIEFITSNFLRAFGV